MEAALLVCQYTIQSLIRISGEDPGFFNFEFPEFPFYPACNICTADVNATINFDVGGKKQQLDLDFGRLTPQTKFAYQPLSASGGSENATDLFMLELLGAGALALTMQSKKLPINVTAGEEQQVSLESVDVYFQDVFGTVWCHRATMNSPVFIIPENVPEIKWDNCNSTNITAQVKAQGLDVTLPLSLPTSAQDSKFSVKAEMIGNGIDIVCEMDDGEISKVLPGDNRFAITCGGDKPHFASGGVLTSTSPVTTPVPGTGYAYSLRLTPRPMPRFLGNSSILYVFYSGNQVREGVDDYCMQSPIVFSDEMPASQDMPTNTTNISYVGENATYSLPMVPAEDANSPNVTVTAFWAWPNNTETDFKCKWTLTSGTPSGCENLSGVFTSNRTFDITVSGLGTVPKTLILTRTATNATAITHKVTFSKAPESTVSPTYPVLNTTGSSAPPSSTHVTTNIPTPASTGPIVPATNVTGPAPTGTTSGSSPVTPQDNGTASKTPDTTAPTVAATTPTPTGPPSGGATKSPNATVSTLGGTSPARVVTGTPKNVTSPASTGRPSVTSIPTSSISPRPSSPPETSSPTMSDNSTSPTPLLTSAHPTGGENITQVTPASPGADHVSTSSPAPHPGTTSQAAGPGNSSTPAKPGEVNVTASQAAKNATSPQTPTSQKTMVPTVTPAGGKANATTGGSNTTRHGDGRSTEPTTNYSGDSTTPSYNATTSLPPGPSSTLRTRWTSTGPSATTTQATVPVPPTSRPRFSNLSMLVLQWASLGVLTLLLLLVMADCAFRRNSSRLNTYTAPPYDDAEETYV